MSARSGLSRCVPKFEVLARTVCKPMDKLIDAFWHWQIIHGPLPSSIAQMTDAWPAQEFVQTRGSWPNAEPYSGKKQWPPVAAPPTSKTQHSVDRIQVGDLKSALDSGQSQHGWLATRNGLTFNGLDSSKMPFATPLTATQAWPFFHWPATPVRVEMPPAK